MKAKIGFIGLGIMGKHMSAHLLNAGYGLVAYDIVSEALDSIVTLGAERGASCKDVAARSDVIISMVPDSPDVEKVALGEDGIIEAARTGHIYIDMSTIAPQVAIEVARARPPCFKGNIRITPIIIFTNSATTAILTGVFVS